jgi:hypothetical protein
MPAQREESVREIVMVQESVRETVTVQVGSSMVLWEYHICSDDCPLDDKKDPNYKLRTFNQLGSEGWELVTAGDIKYGGEVFKRPYKLCPDNTKS